MQAPTVKCRDSEIPLRSESLRPTGELNAPTETRYQTNKITNIFHREKLCTPLNYEVYQPITSECQPNLRRIDIICHNSLKKWLRLNAENLCGIGLNRSEIQYHSIEQ